MEEVNGDSTIDVDLFADEAEPTATEEAPTEETKVEATEETEQVAEPDEETEDEAEPTEETATEGEEAPKPRTAEARKEQLNNEIRTLVSQRNQARAEIEAINAQVYQPQTAEDLIEQGEDPALARIQAMEQRQQMTEYNAQVTDLNANLSVESLQVLSDFPVFNPDAPEYDQALASRAANVYQKAAGIQKDPETGLIIQANVLPYEIYKAFAETHASSVQSGKVNGQRAAEKMLANADTPSSAAPKAKKVDPLTALWSE